MYLADGSQSYAPIKFIAWEVLKSDKYTVKCPVVIQLERTHEFNKMHSVTLNILLHICLLSKYEIMILYIPDCNK
uniref:Uncharacterized protein n=1 Tax=Anguilla anguilla TaxID=7936 RepID=A0A0E9UI32_ANGAN